MEVPIWLQQITLRTLVSSTVDHLFQFNGSKECITLGSSKMFIHLDIWVGIKECHMLYTGPNAWKTLWPNICPLIPSNLPNTLTFVYSGSSVIYLSSDKSDCCASSVCHLFVMCIILECLNTIWRSVTTGRCANSLYFHMLIYRVNT